MNNLLKMALIFLATLNYNFVDAQANNITVSGKVISFEESFALEGVDISVKGTVKSSGTRADGTFSISISSDDKILVFKLEGYKTAEVSLSGNKTYDVVLKRNDDAYLYANISSPKYNKVQPNKTR
jgi:hypothetical protein